MHDKTEDAIGMAGIALKERVRTGPELVAVLKSGDYRLVINGELA